MTAVLTPSAPPRAALADRRPSLSRLTALEIRKSLSTRSGRTLAAVAALLPAVGVAILLALGQQPPSAAEMLGLLGTLVAMLMIAVGVLSTAGEWTHGTAQTTFLTVPGRGRLVTAKYAGMALLGAAIGAVVVGTTFAVAAIGTGPDFPWAGAGAAALATVGAAAAMTVVGAGVGAAVANAPAALTGTYVVQLIAISALHMVRPAFAEKIDALQATSNLIGGTTAVARPVATLVGWVVVAGIAGAVVTRRRAIS